MENLDFNTEPLEVIAFSQTDEERKLNVKLIYAPIANLFAFIVSIVILISYGSFDLTGIIALAVAACLGILFRILILRILRNSYMKHGAGELYTYVCYDDRLEYFMQRDGIDYQFLRVDLTDIKQVSLKKGTYIILTSRIQYLIPARAFPQNSIMLKKIFESAQKNAVKQQMNRAQPSASSSNVPRDQAIPMAGGKPKAGAALNAWLIILTVASPITLLVSFVIAIIIDALWWMPLCAAVLCITASVIVAIGSKKVKINATYIIVAIIVLVASLIAFMLTAAIHFISDDMSVTDEQIAFVEETEEKVGIQLPEPNNAIEYAESAFVPFLMDEAAMYQLSYYIGDAESDAMRQLIKDQKEKWITNSAYYDDGYSDVFGDLLYSYCDVYMIYNVTDGSYNSLDVSIGDEYIIVGYYYSSSCVEIVTFTME